MKRLDSLNLEIDLKEKYPDELDLLEYNQNEEYSGRGGYKPRRRGEPWGGKVRGRGAWRGPDGAGRKIGIRGKVGEIDDINLPIASKIPINDSNNPYEIFLREYNYTIDQIEAFDKFIDEIEDNLDNDLDVESYDEERRK